MSDFKSDTNLDGPAVILNRDLLELIATIRKKDVEINSLVTKMKTVLDEISQVANSAEQGTISGQNIMKRLRIAISHPLSSRPKAYRQRVVSAAMRDTTDDLIVASPRHFDSICHPIVEALERQGHNWEQGFIDQKGRFLTREQAYEVAMLADQVLRRVGGDEEKLFSENIY